MALTDNPNEKSKKRSKNRSIDAGSNFRWSDKQKLEAVQSYLALGNLALTSRILGIPEITLRVWKASTWWKDVVEDIKVQEKIELSARMKKLVEAALTVSANRLENGDPYVNNKTGAVEFKPVAMKDAHRVAVDLMDRRQALEKMTATHDDSPEADTNKLEKLAERFADMALKTIEVKQNNRRTVEVEDAVYVDKDHEDHYEGVPTLHETGGPVDGAEASGPFDLDDQGTSPTS